MKKYLPAEIESKWQTKWKEENLYGSNLEKPRKFYVLAEFPYPSGDLHMGHWFTFSGADLHARFKRMQGCNVFFPNGFDAFGLPAENAAIKRGVHPHDWTLANIVRMKEQFASMGASFTFDHEVITCLPEYYRWNQWIFLKMLEKGLAYKGKYLSNWCNLCQTVLANEGVEGGACWRCGTEVVQKEVDQWFFKITDYAEKLLWPENPPVDWPKAVRDAQNNWIGKSEGVIIKFMVYRSWFMDKGTNNRQVATNHEPVTSNQDGILEVFTTRPDTLFGATFVVVSPEHPLLNKILSTKSEVRNPKVEEVVNYVKKSKKKSELERKENKEKSGVFTGLYVKHPLTGENIPVWVADYVLPGYGTGAVMGVPAHDSRDFEFANKHGLEIKIVIVRGGAQERSRESTAVNEDERGRTRETEATGPLADLSQRAYEEDGFLVNSGEYSGLDSEEAKEKITNYLVEHQLGSKIVYYHLHDWSISRQRYWGTPIPVIYCEKDGLVPVPESDLPVELPYDVDYQPKGKPPLASNEEWLNVKCPKCGGPAKREAETMDTFVDSSWYFFRYVSPYWTSAPFDQDLAKTIMPVDIYFGGAEHNLGHTLYSRFFTKFLHDIGSTELTEFAARRINHGIVLGPDGQKMSKSKGNVVNPDEEVKKYGADTIRVYLSFFMPYEGTGPWVPERVWGAYRFLDRVWGLMDKVTLSETKGHPRPAAYGEPRLWRDRGSIQMDSGLEAGMTAEDLVIMHQTIKKVGDDLENIRYNTAVAALMEWLNHLSRKEKISQEEYKTFLLLLAPFAPHMTEELWEMINGSESIHRQPWPKYEEKYLQEEEIVVVAQVNGKVRDNLVIGQDTVNSREVVEKKALESAKVQKFLEGKEIKKVIYVPGKILNFVTVK